MATKLMQSTIQDALDDLSSNRTSTSRKGRALNNLEKLLAQICGSHTSDSYPLQYFIALQDTFQCNAPSRLLPWLSETTFRLEELIGKGSLDSEKEKEAQILAGQLMQGITIMQGIALQHLASKEFLGRRYAQEILLDLLLVSRHMTPLQSLPLQPRTNSEEPTSRTKDKTGEVTLTSVVLDTLLCVLVDSSPALRVFEETNGVQYVVRILKRAGTPREVRMRCLEFLYFYLMDETTPSTSLQISNLAAADLISTAPNSPVKQSFRSTTGSSISSEGSPSSGYSAGSASSTFLTTTYASSFSASSFMGTSTPKESSSPVASVKSQPSAVAAKISSRILTPPNPVKPRSLLMLKKDVDFIPQSPKKAQVTKLGLGTPRIPSKPREVLSSEDATDTEDRVKSNMQSPETPTKNTSSPYDALSPDKLPSLGPGYRPGHRRAQVSVDSKDENPIPARRPVPSMSRPAMGTRSMQEKREILGGMLGNVEALVEGVRKAGIWGLG